MEGRLGPVSAAGLPGGIRHVPQGLDKELEAQGQL